MNTKEEKETTIKLGGQIDMLRNSHDYLKDIMRYDEIAPEARYLWITLYLNSDKDYSFWDIIDFIGSWTFPTAKKYRDELEEAGLLDVEQKNAGGKLTYTLYLPRVDKNDDKGLNEKHEEIFEKWNEVARQDGEKVLQKHQKLTQQMRKNIDKRLKDYSLGDIKKSIENYAKIVKGREYWWEHVYTLSEFFGRVQEGVNNVERFSDMEIAEKNYVKKDWVLKKKEKYDDYSTSPENWSDETWKEMADGDWREYKQDTLQEYKRVNKLYEKYYA